MRELKDVVSYGALKLPAQQPALGLHLRANTCWLDRAINFLKKCGKLPVIKAKRIKNIILPLELPEVAFDLSQGPWDSRPRSAIFFTKKHL